MPVWSLVLAMVYLLALYAYRSIQAVFGGFSCLSWCSAVLLSLSVYSVMPLKRSVFDFSVFGRVFIGVKSLNAIIGKI